MDSQDRAIFSGGNKRVRDQVLVILSQEFPLTVKQLFGRVSKEGKDVTYQAVHKVAHQLLEEKIVERNEKGIQLSRNWIHQVKDYVMAVEMTYTNGQQYNLPKKIEKTIKFVFRDISTYVVWIAESFRDGKFTENKPVPIFGMFQHAVWPLRFNFMDFEILRSMANNCPTRGFCTSDMPLDRWISRHYKLGGVKGFKTGIKIELHDDFFCAGDIAIRAQFSPETRKYMNQIYTKVKDLKELFQYYFLQERKNEPTWIEVTIEHNPTLARMVEKQVLEVLEQK